MIKKVINKIIISTVLVSATLYSSFIFAGPMIDITSLESLKSYLKNADFNGALLVAKDNEVILKEAYGYKDFEHNIPLTTNDRFQIGSNTKQFVAASILKLQEEGLLSLDDYIVQYVPQLTVNNNRKFDDIKIRDILNHTSGIKNYTDVSDFWKLVGTNLSIDSIVDFISNLNSNFAPRTQWSYSNSGYIIAGKIIEAVSKKSWDQFIKENFLIPLQMSNTGHVNMFNEISDVTGHVHSDGKLVPFKEYNLSWALSAGSFYSTVSDLLKWTAIYSDSNLLSDESKNQMQTPFLNRNGLGLQIIDVNGQDTMIRHGGRTPGFVSQILYFKKSKLQVILLDNVDGDFTNNLEKNIPYFFLTGKTSVIKKTPYPIDITALNKYVGNYVLQGTNSNFEVKIFIKNNMLMLLTNDGQPEYVMTPNDKDSFSVLGFIGVEFLRDSNNNVVTMKNYQDNNISVFVKK